SSPRLRRQFQSTNLNLYKVDENSEATQLRARAEALLDFEDLRGLPWSRADAVDSRTTSSGVTCTICGWVSLVEIRLRRTSAASIPICARGWRMVVSAGDWNAAAMMSSKPIRETSRGT